MSDYDIKFLESHTNLKGVLKQSVGRAPSAKNVNDIAVCLQQGRLFFEAAAQAPMQIKPLQVYYGVAAYAAAVVLARRFQPIENLKQSHGLSDKTPKNARVEALCLRVENDGLFQIFNDTVAQLGRVWLLDYAVPRWRPHQSSPANLIAGREIGFKDIFSRVLETDQLYQQTFGEPANNLPVGFYSVVKHGLVQLEINIKSHFSTGEDLLRMAQDLRVEYPFLTQWQLIAGRMAFGETRLSFQNIRFASADDAADELVQKSEIDYEIIHRAPSDVIDFMTIVPPLTGGITNTYTHVISPIANYTPSEYSIYFLGSFLLSSLVRYHPQIWQKAISKSYTNGNPPDDRCLALIETFLQQVLGGFPSFVVHCIGYDDTKRELPTY